MRSTRLSAPQQNRLTQIAQQLPELGLSIQAILEPESIKLHRPQPDATHEWLKRIDALPGKPNVAAGRHVFFNTKLAQCSNCHRHSGRGNVVGPDLSNIGQQSDRAALLKAIIEPNRDVAPQYYSTLLELDDGTVFSGILLRSSSTEVFRDAAGNERVFQKTDIVRRKELTISLMPTGLADQLTLEELRDLLAFLTSSHSR